MAIASALRNVILAPVSFVIGWTAVVVGNWIWDLLLLNFVFPEYRWGAELTHALNWVSQYVGYLLAITVGGLILALMAKRASFLQGLFASLGAFGAFAVPTLLDRLPLSVLQHFVLEIGFFVLLFPLAAIAWSRVGWLTTRSKRTRAEAARAV